MSSGGSRMKLVEIGKIEEPGHQLRQSISQEALDELKESMGRRGLIEPIKLRPKGDRFEIVAGHRRFLAAKDLRWSHIKAIIEVKSDEDTVLDALHENLHREDMSPIEEARAAKMLQEKEGRTLKEVARMFSKSESWVTARVDLLSMPDTIQKAVDVGALSIGGAREIARITDESAQAYYLDYAIKQGATAQLCAFWRGRWEIERVVNDPSAMASGAALLNPPPMEVEMPCSWCEHSIPIRLIQHIRVCPKCLEALMRTKIIMQQEEHERSREASAGHS